jgi:photosystem II stability/assembly factor-like uncharacterized protein
MNLALRPARLSTLRATLRPALLLAPLLLTLSLSAAPYDASLFSELHWRTIGPFRGGRTKALAGVPSQPNVFYIAAVNGGIFKTDDYGRTWRPIFDSQPTGSIGSIAVAPSDPNIIYAGSGEGLQRPDLSTGDGIYKSTDAGRTWTHLGLRSGQQIPRIVIDPHNPNHLFVAVLGHPYGPNEERGVFRSTDGGQTFEKVLYKDENTGASDIELDPANPRTVYACLWEGRQGPWENGAWSGTNGGIFKSTDAGTTWHPLTKGLPTDGIIQAYLRVSPSNPHRLYATVADARTVHIYRSDDSGDSWTVTTTDPRPAGRIGGGDLSVPGIDPKNPDTLYITSTVTWKSTDAGKTWTGLRGAPGGDDYQNIWINPTNPDVILIVSDQGAIVTVNRGQTWSSWYNQPTAQMYHVAADNAFPYRLCSGQQESGSACVSSRGSDGEVTFREWHPVGVEEYGYVAPDPLNPDLVYGGKVTVYDRRTGQVQNVSPKPLRSADFRALRTAPLQFSTADPHALFFAANTIFKTRDGGHTWSQISPDLTRKTWDIPANIGKYRDLPTAQPSQRGVIYALGLSSLDVNRIWAGTDDGLIHTTADGGLHWKDVTPPELKPFQKVSILDAGHFDTATAYAAINTLRLDDMNPHIYRTHDGGKTWTEIVNGIPGGAPVDVVREDPKRKGLLFAGTEREVYVSFDDGDNWQSLRLNMPATSIRDLIVKDDDLAVGTHGRGFWILDDITPLRQLTPAVTSSAAQLFKPQTATRIRWDMNTDTPLPPDEPAGENPPDGAVINYYLGADISGPVKLEILDATGKLVRRYNSTDPVDPIDPMLAVPTYWVRPAKSLAATPGLHRWAWDLHYQPLPRGRAQLPMTAIAHDTAPAPNSPWVSPGAYTVRLTANGKTYTQPIAVRMDPRVHTPVLTQFTLSKTLYDDILKSSGSISQIRSLRAQIREAKERPGAPSDALDALDKKAQALEGAAAGGRGGRGAAPAGPDTFASVNGSLAQLMQALQESDTAPSAPLTTAVTQKRAAMAALLRRWSTLQSADLAALNTQLTKSNMPVLKIDKEAEPAEMDDDDEDDDIG